MHDRFTEDDRAFLEQVDMFFLATVDASGRPTCSYKGGAPGFVAVLDDQTLAFPNYDGNGMFLSAGNVAATGAVGLLFIDFERQRRMRVDGTAQLAMGDFLLGRYPEAQFVVKVKAEHIYRTVRGTSTSISWSSARRSCRDQGSRRRCQPGNSLSGRATRSRPRTQPGGKSRCNPVCSRAN